MSHFLNILKGWIFDKGGKALAGAGALVLVLDLIDRVVENGEPVRFCIDLGISGAIFFLVGIAIFVAFKSEPPHRD